jgi:hypothetical protein
MPVHRASSYPVGFSFDVVRALIAKINAVTRPCCACSSDLSVMFRSVFLFALPFLIYTIAMSSLGKVHALLIASSPPIAWTIIGFARTRRIDALLAVVVSVDALTPILTKANK